MPRKKKNSFEVSTLSNNDVLLTFLDYIYHFDSTGKVISAQKLTQSKTAEVK